MSLHLTGKNCIVDIKYPDQGKIRARKVISRSKGRSTGKYPSWKMRRMVHWESPHELNAFRLLDANPAVVSFHEQPLVIRFVLGGVEHLHYPDVLVNLSSTRELLEIKSASEAVAPDVVARTRLLQATLPQKGFTYRMVIGEDLAREPRLSTVLTILKYGRQPISLVEHEHIRRLLQATGEISWATALETIGPHGQRILSRLFLEGTITCEIEKQLTETTKFWLSSSLKGR